MTRGHMAAMALVAAATSCGRGAKSAWIVVELPGGGETDEAPTVAPREAARSVAREGGRVVVEVDPSRAAHGVTLSFPTRCEVHVEPRAGETVHASAARWLDLGGPRTELGFDAPFELHVVPGCEGARRGRVVWRQTAGAPLAELTPSDDGFRLSARTAPASLGASPAWGIVPVSPATRGEATLEATWEGAGHAEVRATTRISAIARSRGLPNVPVAGTVLLAGAGWHVAKAPAAAHAGLTTHGAMTALRPDVPGSYELADGDGRTLTLHAARYDETRLDCGRSECHASVARAASASPMTTVLARGMAGAFGAYDPSCALGCHATGEPGLHDGGFVDVARSFGGDVAHLHAGDELPRALHRLGGVGCMACHGPGAIPEPAARGAIVGAGVCAYCHDAPPRYGHVAAWRTSSMAHADRDPRTRAEPACARCHTTAGFLRGVAPASADRATGEPAGITCAACHAVHGDVEPGRALLRRVTWPASLDAVPANARAESGACVACHAPDGASHAPGASAAAVWAGVLGFDTVTGASLPRVAPHASLDGGCVACHREGPAGLERGAGHAFRAGGASCPRCHAAQATPVTSTPVTSTPVTSTPVELRRRALALYRRALARLGLPAGATGDPPHASPPSLDVATPVGRAAYDAALVVEDPAAAAHNPTYARALLDQAERALGAPRE